MRGRYARMTGKKARSKLLDEFVEITVWDQKHANKVLLGKRRRYGQRGKRRAESGERGAGSADALWKRSHRSSQDLLVSDGTAMRETHERHAAVVGEASR